MKVSFLRLFVLVFFVAASVALVLGEERVYLNTPKCTGNNPYIGNLSYIGMYFGTPIDILDNAKAELRLGDEVYAAPTSVYVKKEVGQDYLQIEFDYQRLPKGKTYTIWLKEGSVCDLNDRSVVNADVSFELSVPEHLGETHYQRPAESIGYVLSGDFDDVCDWDLEVELVGEPLFAIYRNDELIQSLPLKCDYDFGMGYLVLDYGDNVLICEEGVDYRIVVPEGCVKCIYRDDLVNEELTFLIHGMAPSGTIQPFDVNCVETKDENGNIIINKFELAYYWKLSCIKQPRFILWNATDGKIEKEFGCYLRGFNSYRNYNYPCYIGVSGINGLELAADKEWHLIMEDGYLVAENMDPYFVPTISRFDYKFDTPAKVAELSLDEAAASGNLYDLNGVAVHNPIPGCIYIMNGKKVIIKFG